MAPGPLPFGSAASSRELPPFFARETAPGSSAAASASTRAPAGSAGAQGGGTAPRPERPLRRLPANGQARAQRSRRGVRIVLFSSFYFKKSGVK